MAKFSGMLVSLRFVNVTRNVTPFREVGLHASKDHILLFYAPELEPADQEFRKIFYIS